MREHQVTRIIGSAGSAAHRMRLTVVELVPGFKGEQSLQEKYPDIPLVDPLIADVQARLGRVEAAEIEADTVNLLKSYISSGRDYEHVMTTEQVVMRAQEKFEEDVREFDLRLGAHLKGLLGKYDLPVAPDHPSYFAEDPWSVARIQAQVAELVMTGAGCLEREKWEGELERGIQSLELAHVRANGLDAIESFLRKHDMPGLGDLHDKDEADIKAIFETAGLNRDSADAAAEYIKLAFEDKATSRVNFDKYARRVKEVCVYVEGIDGGEVNFEVTAKLDEVIGDVQINKDDGLRNVRDKTRGAAFGVALDTRGGKQEKIRVKTLGDLDGSVLTRGAKKVGATVVKKPILFGTTAALVGIAAVGGAFLLRNDGNSERGNSTFVDDNYARPVGSSNEGIEITQTVEAGLETPKVSGDQDQKNAFWAMDNADGKLDDALTIEIGKGESFRDAAGRTLGEIGIDNEGDIDAYTNFIQYQRNEDLGDVDEGDVLRIEEDDLHSEAYIWRNSDRVLSDDLQRHYGKRNTPTDRSVDIKWPQSVVDGSNDLAAKINGFVGGLDKSQSRTTPQVSGTATETQTPAVDVATSTPEPTATATLTPVNQEHSYSAYGDLEVLPTATPCFDPTFCSPPIEQTPQPTPTLEPSPTATSTSQATETLTQVPPTETTTMVPPVIDFQEACVDPEGDEHPATVDILKVENASFDGYHYFRFTIAEEPSIKDSILGPDIAFGGGINDESGKSKFVFFVQGAQKTEDIKVYVQELEEAVEIRQGPAIPVKVSRTLFEGGSELVEADSNQVTFRLPKPEVVTRVVREDFDITDITYFTTEAAGHGNRVLQAINKDVCEEPQEETPTPSVTPTPTATMTAIETVSPKSTETPMATVTASATKTGVPTQTKIVTATEVPKSPSTTATSTTEPTLTPTSTRTSIKPVNPGKPPRFELTSTPTSLPTASATPSEIPSVLPTPEIKLPKTGLGINERENRILPPPWMLYAANAVVATGGIATLFGKFLRVRTLFDVYIHNNDDDEEEEPEKVSNSGGKQNSGN